MSFRKIDASTSFAFCAAAFLAASLPARASATSTHACYPSSADADGDGYAKKGTASVSKSTTSIHCPSGYVDKANDCNDGNSAIHPRRHEIANNQVDDDCDGTADEPEITYPSDIYQITYPNGFAIPTTIPYVGFLCMILGGELSTTVSYRDYMYYDRVVQTPKSVINPNDVPSDMSWTVWVDGVAPSHPYKARVNFSCDGNALVTSDAFYVYNDPADGAFPPAWARYYIVNRALKEVMRSEHGEVGYRGTSKVDGTAYGASTGEKWCSEFYAKMADVALNGISGATTTSDIKSFFSNHGSWKSGLPTYLGSGNYIPMDFDQDGSKDHSTMVLALGTPNSNGDWTVRTIEGNCANEVCINLQVRDASMVGEGLLTGNQNMFDSWVYDF